MARLFSYSVEAAEPTYAYCPRGEGERSSSVSTLSRYLVASEPKIGLAFFSAPRVLPKQFQITQTLTGDIETVWTRHACVARGVASRSVSGGQVDHVHY